MTTINIAKQYTRVPGPRFMDEGPHSGEEFRNTLLLPAFKIAQERGEPLLIELDGAKFGYPTSFLEEAFGGLARQEGIDPVLAVLRFQSSQNALLEEEIRRYIRDCHKTPDQRRRASA